MRINIAEMYLKGKADVWFHGFINSHPNADWNLFYIEVYRRFADVTAEEIIEVFRKIKQKTTVAEYQVLFEDLKYQVMLSLPHLHESYYILVFASGLKEEIISMVKIIRPNPISQAF